MDRRRFLKDSCLTCLGMAVGASVLAGCKTLQQVSGTLTNDGIKIPLDDFIRRSGRESKYHSYIVVRNDALQYPICVYRFTDKEYTALYMRCSHQGAELQAAGDRLTCPAHGSEFDNRGLAKQGPAEDALRSFPVAVMGDELFIDLKKQS